VDEDLDVILERINSLFWDTEKGGIQVQPLEVYGEMFPEMWDKLRDSFIKLANNFTVDIATRRKFGELWVHNNIKNLNKIVKPPMPVFWSENSRAFPYWYRPGLPLKKTSTF